MNHCADIHREKKCSEWPNCSTKPSRVSRMPQLPVPPKAES